MMLCMIGYYRAGVNSNLFRLATGTVIGQSNKTTASFYNVSVCYYKFENCVNRVTSNF